MKNSAFYYLKFLAPILLSLMVVSCQKKSDFPIIPLQTNYIVGTWNDAKTNQECSLVTDIGHDAKNCSGCILINGQWLHVNCQGRGNVCRVSSRLTLYPGGSSMYAVTTDTFGLTDQSFFNMPARSLYTEDEKG